MRTRRTNGVAVRSYGRADFLEDAAWFELSAEQAFSQANLRRERDRLMRVHHPDHGGAEALAAQINIRYTRMLGWLDRKQNHQSFLRMRRDGALEREAARSAEAPTPPPNTKLETIRLYATLVGAATVAVGLGLSTVARRQR